VAIEVITDRRFGPVTAGASSFGFVGVVASMGLRFDDGVRSRACTTPITLVMAMVPTGDDTHTERRHRSQTTKTHEVVSGPVAIDATPHDQEVSNGTLRRRILHQPVFVDPPERRTESVRQRSPGLTRPDDRSHAVTTSSP
jgi:hypothetical protein